MLQDKTIDIIGYALDAAIMRETAIAANIARVNRPNARTLTVDFETQLTSALDSHQTFEAADIAPHYTYHTAPAQLDEQVALSVKNTTQYHALIKGLNHKLAIMNLAIQGNNAS